MDYDDLSGFSLTPKGDILDELAVCEYLETRRDLSQLDIDALKRHRVYLRKETVDEPLARWSVYKSLICELPEGRNIFILMNGEWYRVARTFVGQISDFVARIQEVDVGLPAVAAATTEPGYLEEVEEAGGGLIVLDRKLAYCEEAGHRIEICDVLTSERDHVHIKRKEGGSASLSHLFLQGRNATFALLRDTQFRKEARKHLKEYGAAAIRRVPKSRPKMGSFRVVYAMMGRFTGTVAEALPFFSQLSLMCVVQELAERGVDVAVSKIETG